MTSTATSDLKAPFHLESSGWLAYRKPADRKLAAAPAADLLAKSAQLAGVLRYARTADGNILIGECPVNADSQRSQDRLNAWVKDAVPDDQPDDDELESLLDECVPGCTWKDDHWVVPPDGIAACDRIVRLVPGGVSIEAVLDTWESQPPLHRNALAEFLCRAQAFLRLARLELRETEVRVFSQVETAFLSSGLEHSLDGVAEACRTLTKEVTALAVPELASAYLAFVREQEAVS